MKNILLALSLLATMTLSAQPRGPQKGMEFEYPDAHDPVAAFCDGRLLQAWASCRPLIS